MCLQRKADVPIPWPECGTTAGVTNTFMRGGGVHMFRTQSMLLRLRDYTMKRRTDGGCARGGVGKGVTVGEGYRRPAPFDCSSP